MFIASTMTFYYVLKQNIASIMTVSSSMRFSSFSKDSRVLGNAGGGVSWSAAGSLGGCGGAANAFGRATGCTCLPSVTLMCCRNLFTWPAERQWLRSAPRSHVKHLNQANAPTPCCSYSPPSVGVPKPSQSAAAMSVSAARARAAAAALTERVSA